MFLYLLSEFLDLLFLPSLLLDLEELIPEVDDLPFELVPFFLELDILDDPCMHFSFKQLLAIACAVRMMLVPALPVAAATP